LRQTADGVWEIQGDPTEAAFLVAERKLGVAERRERRFERVGEIPFTSDRKMMSTIAIDHEHDDEVVVISKGAPDVLLGRCTRVREGMNVVALDNAWRERILNDVDALSDAALRTLAVAYRPLEPGEDATADESLERDLIFVGMVGIIDPPREEAAIAIREAHRAGIRVIMITGDHPRTATRIASDLGIIEAGATALTGLEPTPWTIALPRRFGPPVTRGCARTQAEDRGCLAGRRQRRRDDRRRRERRPGAEVGRHRRRDGPHRD
jgi:magnesium-transporting ATPase (P-type)